MSVIQFPARAQPTVTRWNHCGPRTWQIHYAFRQAEENRRMLAIWAAAELLPIGREREYLTWLSHIHAALADLYAALEAGDARRARDELRRWRRLRRAVFGAQPYAPHPAAEEVWR